LDGLVEELAGAKRGQVRVLADECAFAADGVGAEINAGDKVAAGSREALVGDLVADRKGRLGVHGGGRGDPGDDEVRQVGVGDQEEIYAGLISVGGGGKGHALATVVRPSSTVVMLKLAPA